LGSSNLLNVVKATFEALNELKNAEEEAILRGKQPDELLPFWNGGRMDKNTSNPKKLRITYVKSAIGYSWKHKETIRQWGFKHLNDSIVREILLLFAGCFERLITWSRLRNWQSNYETG
jgi:hypothetical protein